MTENDTYSVLLLHSSLNELSQLEETVEQVSSCSVVSKTTNLSSAFDFSEHHTPDLIVSSKSYALRPEFEIFVALLSAIGTELIVLEEGTDREIEHINVGAIRFTLLPRVELAKRLRILIKQSKPRPSRNSSIAPTIHPYSSQLDGNLVLVGASTGGIDALLQILGKYPENGPALMIAQHTRGSFAKSLARLLDRSSKIKVKLAQDEEPLCRGFGYLSPSGDKHLCVAPSSKLKCFLSDAPPQGGHRPSVDVLFHSAVPHAKKVSAALLTGMGKDGAKGLLALNQAGAATFAQDEATSVVFGMPKAAIDLGAVDREVDISRMTEALLKGPEIMRKSDLARSHND